MTNKNIANPWKILSSKKVYESPFIKVYEDKVVTPEGKRGLHNIIEGGGGSSGGVCVAAIDAYRNIFLTKQYRYAYGDFSLEVVGGRIDEGVSPLVAAKTELKEEAGFLAVRWTKIGETLMGTESFRNVTHLYLAEGIKVLDADYHGENKMTVSKMPLENAVQMVLKGEVVHTTSAYMILLVDKFLNKHDI